MEVGTTVAQEYWLAPEAPLQDTDGAVQTWAGQPENKQAAQEILVKLAKANSEAQKGEYKGPHPVPGGQRILQALRLGGSGTA